VRLGTSKHFGGNFNQFWTVLAISIGAFLVLQVAKYFMINTAILLSNTSVHERMLEAIVRSPGSYFDRTPSGNIINRFSNDLGVADSSLVLCFIDMLEGPSLIFVAVLNLCQINPYMILPIAVIFTIVGAFFIFSRRSILNCKKLELSTKTPIFHFFG
jgi:ATP-binding cassette, subfamily C (CFTR/MRP), member 4